jgi:oligopeptide/dipeptide ABC transporter ATP-binding protein
VLEPNGMSSDDPFLDVSGVSKSFRLRDGQTLHAVRDVSFRQRRGETLGVVGESGCGKSTLARLILHLIPASAGRVRVGGEVLEALPPAAMRHKRRDMQMIFQDPQASLDPRMRVGDLIAEPLVIHRIGDRAERRRRVAELCELVGLDASATRRWPHEFSGGQRQRISIARALATRPALVLADEPVSALDVSIQAQILNLLTDIRARLDLTYVFISHDLAVVRHIADHVAVMYLGEIVELAEAESFFAAPLHPYAQMLLASVLEPGEARAADASAVRGEPPSPGSPPSGCSFHPRCPFANHRCVRQAPPVIDIGAGGRAHWVRCWLHL